ncbi:MBL fold metallo-hydrolase [Actinocorallia longicatena]|uniref:MBL fold metallo-hydrolase n=1 Tax=Actinocorallia longicatena TaxID=111803 RepID=UPI0031E2EDA9
MTKIRIGLAAATAAAAWAFRDVLPALGALSPGDRVKRSPHYRDGTFHNQGVSPNKARPGLVPGEFLRREQRQPLRPVPLRTPEFAAPAADASDPAELSVHWLGHGTSVVEIDGRRVLFDPVFSDRVSPSGIVGPKRVHPVPVRAEDLPRLDVIAISHDHYDHLDLPSVRTLLQTQDAPFVVPLGVGAHLEKWGVPAGRIVELDWDEHAVVAGLKITATPSYHFSGRGLKRNPTLWCSFVVATGTEPGRPETKVFYTGDSGYFDGYARIGEQHGPFDLTLMQVGAYSDAWSDIHMTPEEAVTAHLDLRGGLLVPVHWATFVLAMHPWAEPARRLLEDAEARGVTVAIPRPGERVEVAAPPKPDGWWEELA